ncbi:MAG: zf-TFIIB domain-containing protein [Verrucomicrobiota bacterium]|jgi:hypothetical protein
MSSTILLACPKCGQNLRIPAQAGRIHVTCPACREQWDWPKPAAFPKHFKAQALRAFVGSAGARMREWWWVGSRRPRFSYAQMVLMLVAGMGLALFAGYRLGAHRASPAHPASAGAGLPVELPPLGPRATNPESIGDYVPKPEDLLESNGPAVEKPRLGQTNH